MKKEIETKLSALDPHFREHIKKVLESVNISVDLLYEAATRDEKTGLYNSKFFNNILEMELEKAQRGKQKLSFVITDIDFFKKINDTYGHIRGDEILAYLAKLMMKTARKSDVVARFGGEGFVILLPETNLIKAKKFCMRIRKKIHEDRFLKKFKVTVSGGITQYKSKDSKKSLYTRADKALYSAKNSGRDKFVAVV